MTCFTQDKIKLQTFIISQFWLLKSPKFKLNFN